MFRRVLLTAVIAAAVPFGALLAPGAANAATATPCSSSSTPIVIDSLTFNPPSVPAGGTSTLTLTLTNCTNAAVQGQTIWFGKYTGPGTGIPPGCPVIDPIDFPYSVAAGATYTTSQQEGDVLSGCQATGLQATTEATDNTSGTSVEATASLTIVQSAPPPSFCHVTFTPNDWQGGFTANVSIADNSTAPINSWTLTFAFPGDEKITNAWNASVSQSGQNVTASGLAWNNTIQPGGSQSFGFQGTWASSDASPTSFAVNGTTCN